MENTLSIPEKLLLLSIHPEKGGIMGNVGFALDFSIIAGFILEFINNGLIEINDGRVKIISRKPGCLTHRMILSRFDKFNEPLKLWRWFNRLGYSVKPVKNELKSGLAEKRLIRLEGRRFLFFRWQKPFLTERMAVRELISDIDKRVFSSFAAGKPEPILSLIEPAGLMPRLFPEKQKRRLARKRLKQMNVDNEVSIALKRAISAARAAMAS